MPLAIHCFFRIQHDIQDLEGIYRQFSADLSENFRTLPKISDNYANFSENLSKSSEYSPSIKYCERLPREYPNVFNSFPKNSKNSNDSTNNLLRDLPRTELPAKCLSGASFILVSEIKVNELHFILPLVKERWPVVKS